MPQAKTGKTKTRNQWETFGWGSLGGFLAGLGQAQASGVPLEQTFTDPWSIISLVAFTLGTGAATARKTGHAAEVNPDGGDISKPFKHGRTQEVP